MPVSVAIIIPVYNNADTLQELTGGLEEQVTRLTGEFDLRIIYINDASTDESVDVIKKLQAGSKLRIDLLDLQKNGGQVVTILEGLKTLKEDELSIIISADLQDPPSVVKELLDSWSTDIDLVIAARKEHFNLRSEWFHKTVYLFYRDYPVMGFDVVLFNYQVSRNLLKPKGHPQVLQIEMLRASKQVHTIYYEKSRRVQGSSQWSFTKRLKYYLSFLYYYTWLKYIFWGLAALIALALLIG